MIDIAFFVDESRTTSEECAGTCSRCNIPLSDILGLFSLTTSRKRCIPMLFPERLDDDRCQSELFGVLNENHLRLSSIVLNRSWHFERLSGFFIFNNFLQHVSVKFSTDFVRNLLQTHLYYFFLCPSRTKRRNR